MIHELKFVSCLRPLLETAPLRLRLCACAYHSVSVIHFFAYHFPVGSVEMKTRPLDIVYNPASIKRIKDFFTVRRSGSAALKTELEIAGLWKEKQKLKDYGFSIITLSFVS